MSPLVRLWLTQHRPRIDWVDLVDHAYACWRGLVHGLGITDREWDPCEIDPKFTDLPGLAVHALNGEQARPAGESYHTMLPCPVCKVSVGKDCITRFGKVVGPHKARREAAAAQTAAEVQS